MDELITKLTFCLEAVRRYKWPMLGIMTVVSLLACSIVLFKPDAFEAKATLKLSSESMLEPLMDGMITQDSMTEEMAQLMRRSLVARPNLERVIRETDLNFEAQTKIDEQKILEKLAKKIIVKATNQGKLYTISYRGKSARQVKDVVDVLMKIFIEKSIGATSEDSIMSRRFLDLRIKEYEGKLEAAEARLKDFKRENFSAIPAEGQSVFAQMNTARMELKSAKLELREAERRRDALKIQLDNAGVPVSAAEQARLISEADEIKQIEAQLIDLTTRFTDKHPHVVVLRDKLTVLKERQSGKENLNRQGFAATDGGEAYREMVLELGKAEAEVAGLTERVNSYNRLIADLRVGIDRMTAIEAEFSKVNRDYNIIKNTYLGLVQRRESAELTDEVKSSTANVRFEIVEPPVLPVLPSGPSRLILFCASLVLAIGAGVGGAVVLAVLNAPISNMKELTDIAPYPILGVVSSTISSSIQPLKNWRDVGAYGAACGLLLAFYGALILAQIQQFDLAQYLSGVFG